MTPKEVDEAISNLHIEICKVYDEIDKHEDAIAKHEETITKRAAKIEQLVTYRAMVIEAEELLEKINPNTEF